MLAVIPAQAALVITEVAAWSSGNSTLLADWFEVTNTGAVVNITGWKVDDSSNAFASSLPLNGITTIAAGESVIFIETADLATAATAFKNVWFGGNAPSGLQFGSYSGSGIGLSTGGDAVNIFDGSGAVQASVTFGASPSVSPFGTFDNAALLNGQAISTLSVAGTNGAFSLIDGASTLIGSPGTVPLAAVPEPGTLALVPLGLLVLVGFAARPTGRRNKA
jgi:hypothetical protein